VEVSDCGRYVVCSIRHGCDPVNRLYFCDLNSLNDGITGTVLITHAHDHFTALWPEMRMVRWMCGVKLQHRVPSKGLRERPGLGDIVSVLQQNRLRWYGPVLWKDDNDWMKKCMEYEVEGVRLRGKQKKTLREIVEKDCQAHKLNREDAMDRNRWRKQIRDD